MSIDYGTVIAAYSAAMQTIGTWIASRDSRKTHAKAEQSFEKSRQTKYAQTESSKLSNLVPDDVLSIMEERVMACWEQYKNALTDDLMPNEVDAATDTLKNCLCRELQRIYALNGMLPAGKLRKWYHEYC